MGRTGKELRALDEQGTALKADAVARRGRTAGLQAIPQAGVALAGLAILWFASQWQVNPATVAASLSVLALVAIPLQDLAAAWDRYCAWSVAREKAQRLMNEPTLHRAAKSGQGPVPIKISGGIELTAKAGEVTRINVPNAAKIAQLIAGLDLDPALHVDFGDHAIPPRITFIGDTHIGLQGSLRRTVTLGARKRPDDARITEVLHALGLGAQLALPRGLNQRIAENGKGLSTAQTLRLDLARAVLGQSGLIVISSLRWETDPDQTGILQALQRLTDATVILAERENHSKCSQNLEVS